MGTDCRLLAKLKDGTYRHRSLDRLYVFNMPFSSHDSIYDAGGLVENEQTGIVETNYRFSLNHLIEWCFERRRLISGATTKELGEGYIDVAYYIVWLNSALDFCVKMLESADQIEWLGLYADMDDLYFDLQNDDKTIIDI